MDRFNHKPFTPSAWLLEQQIASAMARCDESVEQARLREEARKGARDLRAWSSEVRAKQLRRMWGQP